MVDQQIDHDPSHPRFRDVVRRDLVPPAVGAQHRLLGEFVGDVTPARHRHAECDEARELGAEHDLEVTPHRHAHMMYTDDEVARLTCRSDGCRSQAPIYAIAGTIYGMSQKTTIYLPEELKASIEREAARRGCSEAQVIRDAVEAAVARPAPTPGLFECEPFAARAEELLTGFGER
jgi:hypothetical protein